MPAAWFGFGDICGMSLHVEADPVGAPGNSRRRDRASAFVVVSQFGGPRPDRRRRGGLEATRQDAQDNEHCRRADEGHGIARHPLEPAGPPSATIAPIIDLDLSYLSTYYLPMTGIKDRAISRELKKGSAELLVLSLLESRARHGYEISKLIEQRSCGRLVFHIDSLYPLLYRLEGRGWIRGTWVEKPGERRRRCYALTPEGRRMLAHQRQTWDTFVTAVRRITRPDHA